MKSKLAHKTPPKAEIIPKKLTKHDHTRVDNYYWLNDRENPEVIDYLKAENTYTNQLMAPTKKLQKELFEEMKGKIKQDDNSVPYQKGNYWYYVRYETGKEYPIYCRKKGDESAPEEIMLDGNVEAKGKSYFSVNGKAISSNENLMAYAIDTKGRRICTAYIKDLTTGENNADILKNVTGNMVWANDNQTLFYSRQDSQTLRSYQIWKHVLGTKQKEDVLVFEEKDDTYTCFIYKTKSEKYLVIGSSTTLANEAQILEADNPNGTFRYFQQRERGHEFGIEHAGNQFYITTNWEAQNFRLMRTSEDNTSKENWKEVIAHRPDVLLEGVEVFRDFLVLQERTKALNQIRIINQKTQEDYYIQMDEEAYSAFVGVNEAYNTQTLRFEYESMTTPGSTFDFDMLSKERTLKKQREILGGYNPADYVTERKWATATDGTLVPISIVYKKSTPIDGTAPLLLYSYGSYGISEDVYFSVARLSLLDRGFVYAVAHIRGGQDMGRSWYEDGKLLKKMNTFTDFIDCGDFLVKEKYAAKNKLCAMGGSAGGLLMGAVVNLRPEMWCGIVAAVPFVDVVTTMLDESIPLTTGEYDEWGNPNDKPSYDYMLSYSPYDNVTAKPYPNMLVTTGLHDSQVQYFEPAKWVAKLRAVKTDRNILLLHTDMSAGHGGKSGRFEKLKETAMEWAFLLEMVK